MTGHVSCVGFSIDGWSGGSIVVTGLKSYQHRLIDNRILSMTLLTQPQGRSCHPWLEIEVARLLSRGLDMPKHHLGSCLPESEPWGAEQGCGGGL